MDTGMHAGYCTHTRDNNMFYQSMTYEYTIYSTKYLLHTPESISKDCHACSLIVIRMFWFWFKLNDHANVTLHTEEMHLIPDQDKPQTFRISNRVIPNAYLTIKDRIPDTREIYSVTFQEVFILNYLLLYVRRLHCLYISFVTASMTL